MRDLRIIGLLTCLALTACSTVQEGVVIQKRCRAGMPDPYDLYSLDFRYEPSVYWVRVEGRDNKGRDAVRNIILFRHDWDQLRVGDHWSKRGGFSPAEATGERSKPANRNSTRVRRAIRVAKRAREKMVTQRARAMHGVDAAIDREFEGIHSELWSGTWVEEIFQPSGNGLLSAWRGKGESQKG